MIIEKNGDFSGLSLGFVDMADLSKAINVNDAINYGASFQGKASTERLDYDGQTMLQKGLNWGPFIDYGYFNDGHPVLEKDKDGKVIRVLSLGKMIGIPIGKKAWFEKDLNAWMVSGQFLPHVPEARGLVDIAKSLDVIKADRKLGLSVEGKLKDVSADEKVIKKADIYRVTVTAVPVNFDCRLDLLAKAISDEVHYREERAGTLMDVDEATKIRAIIDLSKSRGIDIEDAITLFYKYAKEVQV